MAKTKHEALVDQLDQLYLQAKRQILQNQSAITGLFPSNSAEKSSASIKTSLWAASSVFALYLAYSKRVDNDKGKAHDLGQSVVKCMRGILFAWMRQSEKVEAFKSNQSPKHALHLKFDLHSGLANDCEYPHLQIDVVSLYLIFLAEFIASGLDIIYCMDEVTFIQNLVYYVERAYRTPDFGNWEPSSASSCSMPCFNSESLAPTAPQSSSSTRHRVSELNSYQHNQPHQLQHQVQHQQHYQQHYQQHHEQQQQSQHPPEGRASHQHQTSHDERSLEIHATSIGMAKSALEAINGCNLFGGKGANWSIIYSDIDAHSRNRSIFETLLPRESRSKNTDSYLLATISWPCFATHDPQLYQLTKSKILRKLRGKHGLKRFLRDPYGTAVDDCCPVHHSPSATRSNSLSSCKLASVGTACDRLIGDPLRHTDQHQSHITPTKTLNSLTPTTSTAAHHKQASEHALRELSFCSTASASTNVSASASSEPPKTKHRRSSYQQRRNNQHQAQLAKQTSGPLSVATAMSASPPEPRASTSSGATLVPTMITNHHHHIHHHHHHHHNVGVQQASSCPATTALSRPTSCNNDHSRLQRVDSAACKMSKRYEHIESEWPLFVCFLIIDGIFKQDLDQIYENERLLYERLLKIDPKYGDYLIPKYYYVPADLVHAEKCNPDSVERKASLEGSSSEKLYLTGQSILLITRLLLAGLVHPNELDPLRRHMPSHDRPKRIGRYSSFQASSSDLVVQTVLIAESIRLQAMMANYGIQTQTPLEVEPVQIWSSAQLVKVYEYLGVNEKLGLRGRPSRPIGALGTSKLYRICGQTILCYPLIFEVSDFYLAQDMLLLIDDIQNELNFIGRYWRMSGRPTVCIIIREEHLRDVHFRDLLDLLVQFKNGQLKKSGLRIKTGRLQNLISSSCIEHLDFLHLLPHEHLPQFESFRQLVESPKESLLNTAMGYCDPNPGSSQPSAGHRLANSRSGRRAYLSSASSHNLQAIEEMHTAGSSARLHDPRLASTSRASNREDRGGVARGWTQEDETHDVDPDGDLDNDYEDEGLNYDHSHLPNPHLDFNRATETEHKSTRSHELNSYSTYANQLIDYYECYKDSPTWPTLVELLRNSVELSSQSQLLAILWEREGAKYQIDELTIEQRLERLSQQACQVRNWSVVRYCSAVLKRSVESLSPWLTSILVNGKQISLGTGTNERIVNNPLTPIEIHTLIYSTINSKNRCDVVLQQEIALYIGRLISTRPDYFEGILTIRVTNFMSAMRSYLNIKTCERKRALDAHRLSQQSNQDHTDVVVNNQVLLDLRIRPPTVTTLDLVVNSSSSTGAPAAPSRLPQSQQIHSIDLLAPPAAHERSRPPQMKLERPASPIPHRSGRSRRATPSSSLMARPLESLSPSEVRKLLVKVLNEDDESLPISERRHITGELCRVPKEFYSKVWSLLSSTTVGIIIGGRMLRSASILTNMTQDDLNFALKVESLLSAIECPKLRQINVELLMALHVILERHPEIKFESEALDLDKIINLSLDKFRTDHGRQDCGLREYYTQPVQSIVLYTWRTVFDCLLPDKYKTVSLDCKLT